MNANTTPKSRRKSAEQLFIELLEQYQVSKDLVPLIELQLTKLFNHYNADKSVNENQLKKQLSTLQNQLKQLKIRFGLNQIDKDTYDLTTDHLVKQIQEISKEMGSGNEKTSNLEKLISQSLKKLENLSKIWGSSDFDGKRILHKTMFPDGVYFNAEKHEYLTRKVNGFVELVSSISTAYFDNKKRNFQNSIEISCLVPESSPDSYRDELPSANRRI